MEYQWKVADEEKVQQNTVGISDRETCNGIFMKDDVYDYEKGKAVAIKVGAPDEEKCNAILMNVGLRELEWNANKMWSCCLGNVQWNTVPMRFFFLTQKHANT